MTEESKVRQEWTMNQGWKWIDLNIENWHTAVIKDLEDQYPLADEWLKEIPRVETSYLSVRLTEDDRPAIFGSLLYSVKLEIDSSESCNKFHFFLSDEVFITINLDESSRKIMASDERIRILRDCPHPRDGLFILARTMMHYFHTGMDNFEANLRKVEDSMRKRNKKNIMDRILNSRFELLYWHNLFIPFQELLTAAREAYLEEIDSSVYFKRYFYRLERVEQLFIHYEREIDTLISIDDAISAFRGNEITKTLTIIASIFTPATVIGAIWGMNFDYLPWTKNGVWGFVLVSGLILLSTVTLGIWLKAKGWTGDLLDPQDNESNL
ncbi:magnesium transporter CorA family protein [Paenibacillus sp. YPG26]|uniref:magnesium transporter CorA family protein n=1 Tax=Paenibacillus sp. YPG26 TaxID=2878915 RepID=UPI002040289E|nr:magnesium transporter CorA family protein [Paenibacillus sp. YPG26]USB32617.1 magnesium transporter CorA family protein [Paenibacillus sp. YPG26]